MKRKLFAVKPLIGLAVVAASAFTACSGGGGGSSPAPIVSAPLGGIGPDIPFDQKVNFTVVVPPPATLTAVAAARRKRRGTLAGNTNPYVSPNIASLTLQVGTVNGQSPRLLPASQTFAVTCPGVGGCSIPIQNVPAAKGVDRFAVTTFAGPGGTGNIVSSGFIDVTVPSAQAISFGGTSLTIGGFVASLSLAFNIPGGTFFYGVAANGTLDVNAIDPAGAIIIGSDQLASPITISFTNPSLATGSGGVNNGVFSLNALQQVALEQPAQPVTLAYSGATLVGEEINASTTDENSQPVSTSIPIPIRQIPPPPTPPPPPKTPPPVTKTPLSLYVYDGAGDRIIEYGDVNAFEGGKPFNTTARRVFEIAPPDAVVPTLQSCASAAQLSPILTGFAVSSTTGTIYAQTSCLDAATGIQDYIFTYSAATQEAVPPQSSPIPPAPQSIFSVPMNTAYALTNGIKLDEGHNLLYVAFSEANGPGGNQFVSVPSSGLGNVVSNIGSTCIQEIGFSTSCLTDSASGYAGFGGNFAIDINGFVLSPTDYTPFDANGNGLPPPGDPAATFFGEPTIAYLAPGQNAAPNPVSALAGIPDELGSSNAPQDVAIEGSTLYTLQNPSTIFSVSGGDMQRFYPGLSGCPLPSANAIPDATATLCTNGNAVSYLAAYANAPQTLAAANNAGKNVIIPPTAMVGGDAVGNFGAIPAALPAGDALTVRDGYAYVIQQSTPVAPAEIDVYNMNNVTGYHTDIAPSARIVLDSAITPTSIAIGATGTGLGGQAILRRPARVHHDVKAWSREIQRRRAQHQIRRPGR